MARRTRTVYRTARRRARSYGRGLLGGMGGLMNNLIAGGVGGVAANIAGGFNAQYGPGAGMAVAGMLMKNQTLQTLAGMSLGQAIAGQVTGGSGASGQGWY